MHHMDVELIKHCNQRLEWRSGDSAPSMELLERKEAAWLCYGGTRIGPKLPLGCRQMPGKGASLGNSKSASVRAARLIGAR